MKNLSAAKNACPPSFFGSQPARQIAGGPARKTRSGGEGWQTGGRSFTKEKDKVKIKIELQKIINNSLQIPCNKTFVNFVLFVANNPS